MTREQKRALERQAQRDGYYLEDAWEIVDRIAAGLSLDLSKAACIAARVAGQLLEDENPANICSIVDNGVGDYTVPFIQEGGGR